MIYNIRPGRLLSDSDYLHAQPPDDGSAPGPVGGSRCVSKFFPIVLACSVLPPSMEGSFHVRIDERDGVGDRIRRPISMFAIPEHETLVWPRNCIE